MSNVTLSCLRTVQRAASRIAAGTGEQIDRLQTRRWLSENFQARDEDIYVAAFPKSGTTWMQMLLYQLTTNGDIGFDHIYQVSPWLDFYYAGPGSVSGVASAAVDVETLPSPRILKTHFPYRVLPRGMKGRFIFVTRDCLDVAVSMLHHQRSYYDPSCTFDEVFDSCFRGRGMRKWFEYTRDWTANRYGRPILYVRYEDMKRDLEAVIHRIVRFCDLAVDRRDFARILERSSFAFMKLHQDKFGERPAGPVHQMVFDNFIRKGEVGEGGNYGTEEQLAFLREKMRTLPSRFSFEF